jgi:RNA polymerase sigma factor (TIGR02999 family)
MGNSPGQITALLGQLRKGNREAESRLMPLVYSELRKLARRYMRAERPDHTLQATALVNEAYLRLVGQTGIDWQNRAHFYGIAAQMMRRVLVDHARAHRAEKRGAGGPKISLSAAEEFTKGSDTELLALDEMLNRLSSIDPRQSRVVELRFFGGLSEEETAETLGISVRTVKRDWNVARAWLYRELTGSEPQSRISRCLATRRHAIAT